MVQAAHSRMHMVRSAWLNTEKRDVRQGGGSAGGPPQLAESIGRSGCFYSLRFC
jgi:hypothetical protein